MADNEETQAKRDYKPPPGAETSARWTGGSQPLDYTATASWLVLRKKEKPSAEIFSASYVVDGGDQRRPVAFVFNGGPGASSAYLHMGAVGPQRVGFPADGTLPELPPKLVQNESSWLAFADLVFVDPVGTGFSRIIEPDKKDEKPGKPDGPPNPGDGEKPDPNEYFGQKRDLESLCEFMARWLSENDRWSSPVFIAGESYGGYRVGRLVRMLQEETGIGLNGAILISPALELIEPDGEPTRGRIPMLVRRPDGGFLAQVMDVRTNTEWKVRDSLRAAGDLYMLLTASGAGSLPMKRFGTQISSDGPPSTAERDALIAISVAICIGMIDLVPQFEPAKRSG